MTGCLWTLNRGWQDVNRYPEPVTTTYVIDPPPHIKHLYAVGDPVRVVKGPYAGEEGTIRYFVLDEKSWSCVVALRDELVTIGEDDLEPMGVSKEALDVIPC